MRNITIKSSIELTLDQKRKLEEGIRGKENEELIFSYEIDKLIGGIVIIDGEKLVDASMAAELGKIKKAYDNIIKDTWDGISVNDIPELLKSKLADVVDHSIDVEICGKVISAADGVVQIDGLSNCRYGELLLVGKKGFALALNLEKDRIGAILLSETETVEYGDLAFSTGKILEVPVGNKLLGRVVNPLGQPLDGKSRIITKQSRRLESEAPGIIEREKVTQPLSTGILAIDAMVPIGKGQRELIIGDRQTGKTSIAIDTIINQRGKNVQCVYVAIGQRASSISQIVSTLEEHRALSYTTIVMSTAADSAPLQYLAPYTGTAIAEYFMHKGKDVLIIYDDLSKHAVAYRTISLLLRRPAGREAYPGDVFYIHSRLLERAAKLNKKYGGGSLTALPIVETQAGDISAYIPTNIISITDGQIYLERELFNAGQRPAVNVGLSVSRVGGAAQPSMTRKLSAQLRLDIAHYRELAIFSQFGSSLDDATQQILERGEKMVEALKQKQYRPLSILEEEIYLFAIAKGYLDSIPLSHIRSFLKEYFNYMFGHIPGLTKDITELSQLGDDINKVLPDLTEEFIRMYTDGM